jgi:hypothetical protein
MLLIIPSVFISIPISIIYYHVYDANLKLIIFVVFVILLIFLLNRSLKHHNRKIEISENLFLVNNDTTKYLPIFEVLEREELCGEIDVYITKKENEKISIEVSRQRSVLIIGEEFYDKKIENIKSLIYHEIFHHRFWLFQAINFTFKNSLKEINHKKNQVNKRYGCAFDLLGITYLNRSIELMNEVIITITYTVVSLYSSFINETFADFYAIDKTKSSGIIRFLRSKTKGECYDYKMYDDSHLEPKMRIRILEEYFSHKYMKRDHKLWFTKLIIIFVAVVLSSFAFSKLMILISQKYSSIPVEYLKNKWIALFNNNEKIALAYFLLFTSVLGSVFGIRKWFSLSYYNASSIAEIRKNAIFYTSLSLFMGCIGLMILIGQNIILLILALVFGIIFRASN